MYFLIDVSQALPKFGVEVVLDAVVSPVIFEDIPAWQFAWNQSPFIANLILHAEQQIFLLDGPLRVIDVSVQMIMVPTLRNSNTFIDIAFHFYPIFKIIPT